MGGVAQGQADRDVFMPKAQDLQLAASQALISSLCLEPSKTSLQHHQAVWGMEQ